MTGSQNVREGANTQKMYQTANNHDGDGEHKNDMIKEGNIKCKQRMDGKKQIHFDGDKIRIKGVGENQYDLKNKWNSIHLYGDGEDQHHLTIKMQNKCKKQRKLSK